MNLSLKSNLKVFPAIPSLSSNDRYKGYITSVLNHLLMQKTSVNLMKPYVTPPHTGKFSVGMPDRLHAIVGRMNNVVDKFMTTDATHVFFNDGDVEIPPNCIDTLIRHNVDVASGVYPWHNFDKSRAMMFGRMHTENTCGYFRPRIWEQMKEHVWGEEEHWSGGTGCMLVKRRVFEQHHPKLHPLRFNKDNDCGGDVLFWKRVQDAGFTARVDANVVCGHLPDYPLRNAEEWLKPEPELELEKK